MYAVSVMPTLRKLLVVFVPGILPEQKKSRCRIRCRDLVTGHVSEQPWFGIESEPSLEKRIKDLKDAPKLGNTPFADRFEFTIDHA